MIDNSHHSASFLLKYVLSALNKPTLWLLSAFFLLGLLPQLTSFFESAKQYPVQPVSMALNLLETQDTSELAVLRKENISQKNQIVLLKKQIEKYRNKIRNYKDFKIATKHQQNYPLIDAEVLIGTDLSEWRLSFAINRGSADDVKTGYPVISGNVLIGRIAAVGLTSSRVQLIVDPAFPGVKAIVVPEKKGPKKSKNKPNQEPETQFASMPHGFLKGSAKKDWELSLLHIPLVEKVEISDKIFVSNQSSVFPGGLYIGDVKKVMRDGNPKFFRVDVEPAVNPKKLEFVQVVIFENKLLDLPK